MNRQLRLTAVLTAAVATSAALARPTRAAEPVFPAISGTAVLEHTKVLASDAFEGRAPGTQGEDLTVAYLVDQLKKIGLQPGNPDGTLGAEGPARRHDRPGSPRPHVPQGRHGAPPRLARRLRRLDEARRRARGARRSPTSSSSATASRRPSSGGTTTRASTFAGKTMVVLVGDPPVPDPAKPGELDPKMFGGKAMTYYGRWTYKYEMGAKLGAAAVLIVHETGPAGYPFAVVQGKTAEQFDLETADGNQGRAAVEGWITLDQAKALFAMAGQDFEALEAKAATPRVPAGPAGGDGVRHARQHDPQGASANVAAAIDGSDPALKNDWVIYTTHWDHFGIGPAVNGDTIYHGAVDNASGTGGLIELARALHARHAEAAPVDPLPLRHGRGAGSARLDGIRREPALPAGEDGGRPEPRRPERARTDPRPHHRRSRALRPRRRRPEGRRRPGQGGRAGSRCPRRARSSARTTSRSLARACRRSTRAAGSTYVGKPAEWGTKIREDYIAERLPQAVGRREARLGHERRRRGPRPVPARGVPARVGTVVARLEAGRRVEAAPRRDDEAGRRAIGCRA